MNAPSTRHTSDSAPPPFQFQIVHVLYVMALLPSSAILGPSGFVAGLLIIFFWALVFRSFFRPKTFVNTLTLVSVVACVVALLLPATDYGRPSSRNACSNNLKKLGIAFHNYHDQYGSFPPAYIADETGKPKHSWRVLILPFMEEQALYGQYDFNEPWDGPKNSKLRDKMPRTYMCPSAGSQHRKHLDCTSYLAGVGPETGWPAPTARSISEFTDGIHSVMLLVEHNQQDVCWLEPRDLTLNEALQDFTAKDPMSAGNHESEDFFWHYCGCRNVCLADGAVRFVGNGLNRDSWLKLLRIDDGPLPDEDFGFSTANWRRLKIGNCVGVGLWIFLVLLPLPWVFVRRSATDKIDV